MANRYMNIDTSEEDQMSQQIQPHPQSQPSKKKIHRPIQSQIQHVKFYFVQKDYGTGRRLSKQI